MLGLERQQEVGLGLLQLTILVLQLCLLQDDVVVGRVGGEQLVEQLDCLVEVIPERRHLRLDQLDGRVILVANKAEGFFCQFEEVLFSKVLDEVQEHLVLLLLTEDRLLMALFDGESLLLLFLQDSFVLLWLVGRRKNDLDPRHVE